MSTDSDESPLTREAAEKLLQDQMSQMMAAMSQMETLVTSTLENLNSRVAELSARVDQLRPPPPT
jgi:polyhydroxyalkanoate synthesis regulator phasin